MSATEEQLSLVAGAGVDHASYVLVLYSIAFIMYLFVNLLIHLYVTAPQSSIKLPQQDEETNGDDNYRAHLARDARRAKDAEEFELEGLISDAESVGTPAKQSETVEQ
jgi:hypothetical protein